MDVYVITHSCFDNADDDVFDGHVFTTIEKVREYLKRKNDKELSYVIVELDKLYS